jgi:3-deoxy-D-manno-octulosonic-acid transferase
MTNAKNLFEIGDTRIDRVLNIAKQIYKNKTIEQFIGNSRCLIVGSSWEHEEAIIEKALPHLIEKNIKVIIAPHDINRANEIAKQYNNCILYTEANIKNTSNNFILILNTIGILSKVYRYGNYAIIGGGFSNKLHNIYEAAVYGIPVMYGPNNSKYPEAKTLVNAEIGFEIKNEQTLIEVVNNIKMGDIKQKSKLFYAQNSGIVERISHVLETDLK